MDGIRALMDGGSHGNLATLEPQLSPMLWTSIATGKMAYHHGVEGFTEVDPVSGGGCRFRRRRAAAETRRENQWSLARAYLYSGKTEQALPLLEHYFAAYPERSDYAQALARTQLALGLADEAEETLAICLESFGNSTSAHILQGQICTTKGQPQQVLEHVEKARAQAPRAVPVLELSCRAYGQLGRWEEARATAACLLGIDPSSVQAYVTLARGHLQQRQPEQAVESALAAIDLQFASPRAHQLLGRALMQLGQWEAAERALGNALQLAPHDVAALEALQALQRQRGATALAQDCADRLIRLRLVDDVLRQRELDSRRRGGAARAAARHVHHRLGPAALGDLADDADVARRGLGLNARRPARGRRGQLGRVLGVGSVEIP